MRIQKFKLLNQCLTVAALAVVLYVGAPTVADDDNEQDVKSMIVAPNKTLFGKSYEELAARWANWAQKEPKATSPLFDTTGELCNRNQKGEFWYLAGSLEGVAERICVIPEGKAIFFPIINYISFPPEFPDADDPCSDLSELVEQIRCDVNEDIDVNVGPAPNVPLRFTLDGEPVNDLFAYRVQSRPGGFKFWSGPLFEELFSLPAGPRNPAVVDGYWILIKPLKPGMHSLSFSADDLSLGEIGANYTLVIDDNDD